MEIVNKMLDVKMLTFYLIFIVVYLFSGLLTMLTIGVIPYKMMYTTLFVIPLVIYFGIPIDRFMKLSLSFLLIVLVSSVINRVAFTNLILFLRNIVGVYLVIYIADKYIIKDRIKNFFTPLIIISIIQLPIVLFQQATYELMPDNVISSVVRQDFDFGTFNFKADHSLAFFIILILITILMNKEVPIRRTSKIFIAFWITATVMIVNSKMSQLIVLLIWIVYILWGIKNKNITAFQIIFLFFPILIFILMYTNLGVSILNELRNAVFHIRISGDRYDITEFLQGRYSRAAALYYYLFQRDIILIGDGPGRYFNPLSSSFTLGNTGHIFTFYAEIGIIGLVISYLIFWEIIRRGFEKLRSIIKILFMGVIAAYSFTAFIMSDITFPLTLFLISKLNAYYLIKGQGLQKQNINKYIKAT